jgi:hypothetical protein
MPTYTIEHFYWGKFVQDKQPFNEFRIIAISTGWTLEDVHHAFERVYVGSHNGVDMRSLQTETVISTLDDNAQSDTLVAIMERSQHIERSAYYPEYHVMRLPFAIAEALNHDTNQLATLAHRLHQRMEFTQFTPQIEPLSLTLNDIPTPNHEAWQTLITSPIANDAMRRTTLFNHLLAGGKVVVLNAPSEVWERLEIIAGFQQGLPMFARQRINGATGIFKSTESPLRVQMLYQEDYNTPAPGALHVNWRTGDFTSAPPTTPHLYTTLLNNAIQVDASPIPPATGDDNSPTPSMSATETLLRDVQALYEQYADTRQPYADALLQVSWRYAYNSQVLDDTVRTHLLRQLIAHPLRPEDIAQDASDLLQSALNAQNASALHGMSKLLRPHEGTLLAVLQSHAPLKQTFATLKNAHERQDHATAQWLFSLILGDERLLKYLIHNDIELVSKLMRERLQQRLTDGLAWLQAILPQVQSNEERLETIGRTLVHTLQTHDDLGAHLPDLFALLKSPLRYDERLQLLHVIQKTGYLLTKLFAQEDVQSFLLITPESATRRQLLALLSNASDADIAGVLRLLMPDDGQSAWHPRDIFAFDIAQYSLVHPALHPLVAQLWLMRPNWQPLFADYASHILRASPTSPARDAFFRRQMAYFLPKNDTSDDTLQASALAYQDLCEAYNSPLASDDMWQALTNGRTPQQYLLQWDNVQAFFQQLMASSPPLDDVWQHLSPEEATTLYERSDALLELLQSFEKGGFFGGKSQTAEHILGMLAHLRDTLAHALADDEDEG